MKMHFEREKEDSSGYSVVELRTDTKLAAKIRATRDGIVMDLAEGFTFPAFDDADDIHVEIREREG
jgi:hypothetical protein